MDDGVRIMSVLDTVEAAAGGDSRLLLLKLTPRGGGAAK
jgi:hypothetical protein